ncbi:hypothetical protein [Martelella sp. AMO21009]
MFPSGQIAALRQGAEAVQLGTVDFVWSDMGTLGNWRPEYGFVSLPFLFSGNEHFAAFLRWRGRRKGRREPAQEPRHPGTRLRQCRLPRQRDPRPGGA